MKHAEKPNLPEGESDPNDIQWAAGPSGANGGGGANSVDSVEAGSSDAMMVTPNPKDKGSMCNRFTVENESSSLSNDGGTGKF